ncbi:arabinose-proton symporter [Xylaria sp. FL1042]|nr:arabinose-proton symporter [Xylaria sp. FL1042]
MEEMGDKALGQVPNSEHVERTLEVNILTTSPANSGQPGPEIEREPQGKLGLAGILDNKYVTLCAAFAALGGGLFGYDQGVVSVTLVMPQFIEAFPEIAEPGRGAFNKGILTAVLELGAFLGALNQGWLADKISRRRSILVAVAIFLFGSALQTGAMNYDTLVAGRFVGGIGIGMLAMVGPLYISEIAPPEIRGTLLTLQELSIVTAIVVAYYTTYGTRYIQSQWSFRLPFLLQIPLALLLGLGIRFLPYSPRWLVSKGRNDEALQVLSKLRALPATDSRVLNEWLDIRAEATFCKETNMERHPKLHDGRISSRVKLQLISYLDCFRGRLWKRTHVAIGLMFFQQFGGVNALIYYSPTLFATMGLGYDMQLNLSGALNIAQMVACFWSLWGLDRYGRRPCLLGGAACMFVAHFIIAVLVGLYSNNWAAHSDKAWVSVAFLFFYMLTYSATWGPIPWAMPSEIFPISVRAKGTAYGTMSNWLNNFIIGLVTPPLISNTGFGTYVFFAAFCFIAIFWTWFFVPETKNKTLEQMDQVFEDNSGERELAHKAEVHARIAAEIWGVNNTNKEDGGSGC